MLPYQQAGFTLTAMTLRGIGSYLHGARLELRPLTILCGRNGSGKSTWLKALDVLRRSLEADTLPFGFVISDWSVHDIQFMNAFWHLASPEDHVRVGDPKASIQFGPPGTIGLEFVANRDAEPDECEEVDARAFLETGRWTRGTRFRLRIAHPSYCNDRVDTPEFSDLVELQIDGRFLIKMEGSRDASQGWDANRKRWLRSKPYELECSSAFLSESNADDTRLIKVGRVVDLDSLIVEPYSERASSADAMALTRFFILRVKELLRSILDGYVDIGAIRGSEEHLSQQDFDIANKKEILRRLHVGRRGEAAWLLERSYATSTMRGRNNLH